jgi:putative transposase
MILTYKFHHNRDFSTELKQAFKIAEYVVNPVVGFSRYSFPSGRFIINNMIKRNACRSSKVVKNFNLPSSISNQILKKYGNQKKIKNVHSVNLIIPGQGVKFYKETNSIWIPCLKLHLENIIPVDFDKINQIEIDDTYAYISVIVPEKSEMIPYENIIGVDRNTTGHIVVTANINTGQVRMMGKKAQHIHTKYRNIRKSLQDNGQYRKIKRIKNRENRIVKDLNHKISKELVQMAQTQHAVLVFEDLSGIRNTKKQNCSFKPSLHSWSFYQLQTFVEYKAKLLGVPYLYVDPAYTSQDCSRCGARGKRNKKVFKCPACGHVNHADVNAAFNIALRQKNMIARIQTMMCTMGVLMPHDDALLEREYRLEPHRL